jgi:cytochrome c-type biogenesis protein CcmE
MTRKRRRLVLISSALGVLAVAVALILSALKDSIVFFNSPTDVVEKHVAPGSRIRLGGLVRDGSVVRGSELAVRFDVLDPSGTFKADSVLAKHDEKYMPKEVADALKKSGHWKENEGTGPQARTQ